MMGDSRSGTGYPDFSTVYDGYRILAGFNSSSDALPDFRHFNKAFVLAVDGHYGKLDYKKALTNYYYHNYFADDTTGISF